MLQIDRKYKKNVKRKKNTCYKIFHIFSQSTNVNLNSSIYYPILVNGFKKLAYCGYLHPYSYYLFD